MVPEKSLLKAGNDKVAEPLQHDEMIFDFFLTKKIVKLTLNQRLLPNCAEIFEIRVGQNIINLGNYSQVIHKPHKL